MPNSAAWAQEVTSEPSAPMKLPPVEAATWRRDLAAPPPTWTTRVAATEGAAEVVELVELDEELLPVLELDEPVLVLLDDPEVVEIVEDTVDEEELALELMELLVVLATLKEDELTLEDVEAAADEVVAYRKGEQRRRYELIPVAEEYWRVE